MNLGGTDVYIQSVSPNTGRRVKTDSAPTTLITEMSHNMRTDGVFFKKLGKQ